MLDGLNDEFLLKLDARIKAKMTEESHDDPVKRSSENNKAGDKVDGETSFLQHLAQQDHKPSSSEDSTQLESGKLISYLK